MHSYMRRLGGAAVCLALMGCVSAEAVQPRAPAKDVDWFVPCYDGTALRFATGFDDGVRLDQSADGLRASFVDGRAITSCATPKARPPGLSLGRADIQYEGGRVDERMARIESDPVVERDQLMEFRLEKANVRDGKAAPHKGRIQMNIYENEGVRQVRMTVRMYLSQDFKWMRDYPGKVDWLTISEWWNNAGWTGEAYPFRISVNLVNQPGAEPGAIHFKVHAQELDLVTRRWNRLVWERVNRDFSVPLGKWVTLEYVYVEGNARKGRFYLAATPEGGKRVVVFDVTGYTQHPDDPSPDGLRHWNPLKLYTSRELIDYVRRHDGALDILWDDLHVSACGARDTGCAPLP